MTSSGGRGYPIPAPEVPFNLSHKDPTPPQAADREPLYQLRLTVSAQAATTRDDLDRLLDQLAAAHGATVASSAARLHSMSWGGVRPSQGR